RPADRGRAGRADPPARRRGGARGAPPVHGDARHPQTRDRGDARGARGARRRALGGDAEDGARALTRSPLEPGDPRDPRALPSVSVIVVTRDRPRFLAEALAGVAAQQPAPLEVRVGDDGGGSSAPVVESLPLLQVTLLPLSYGHAAAARNAAAAAAAGGGGAAGPGVGAGRAFLDDDDVWRPNHLAGLGAACVDPELARAWRDSEVVRERVLADGTREPLARRRIAREWDHRLMQRDDY